MCRRPGRTAPLGTASPRATPPVAAFPSSFGRVGSLTSTVAICASPRSRTGAAKQAAIIEASMPAAVMTTVLALEFNLDAEFSTSLVFVTTLLSPVTLVLLIAYLQR